VGYKVGRSVRNCAIAVSGVDAGQTSAFTWTAFRQRRVFSFVCFFALVLGPNAGFHDFIEISVVVGERLIRRGKVNGALEVGVALRSS